MALAAVFLFAGQTNAIAANPVDACNGSNHYSVGHSCAFQDSQGKSDTYNEFNDIPTKGMQTSTVPDQDGTLDSLKIKVLKESSKREEGTEFADETVAIWNNGVNEETSTSIFGPSIRASWPPTVIMAPYRPALSTTRKPHYRIPYSPIRPYKRSPLEYHRNRSGPRRSTPPESRSRRVSNIWHQRPLLDPIYESPLSRRRQEVSFDFEDSFRVPVQREDADDDEDVVLFPWEDEETLIADLSHDGRVKSDDDENVVKLIDSLEHSFTHYSNILVDDIAQTLVPAVRRVKEAHHVLNTRVDDDFGKGLWEFHETCKRMELATLKDADEVKEEYEAAQVRIADIMGKLEDAYARRDQLWVDFEVKLNNIVDPTIEMLKELPARMERAISEIDKQSKKLNKDDVGPEKTLKDLLTKLN
ncbi:hypothetical protein IW262DRAFT_1456022 [Armillaria fumosa]|nr:hypothetical protein IW262DRAFT_1456022 [Armillaria fumosa]